jgi:hypothetical protein
MRTAISPQSPFAYAPFMVAPKRTERTFKCPLPLPSFRLFAGAAALFAVAAVVGAQTPTTQSPAPASTTVQRPIHPHKRPTSAQPAVAPATVVSAPITPPVPETPKWPAFDHPVDASVIWDSQGLSIDAHNSSLQQILKDVSTVTGVRVEGLNADERVFGAYGPGQARDVLSQLLQGSSYNVIMVGDLGQGAPRQIVLSARQATGSQPAARSTPSNSIEEDDSEEQPPPQEAAPIRGFPPGTPPRTPQQIMQEMQQRQQQQLQPGQTQPSPQPQN